MSRLEVPLIARTLRTTSAVVVHAELVLAIKTDRGSWELLPFLVDPGTEMTTMSAWEAKNRNLPMPRQPVSGLNFQGLESAPGCSGRGFPVWTPPNMSSRVTFSVIRTPRWCPPGNCSA
jgi:hypothetical protein